MAKPPPKSPEDPKTPGDPRVTDLRRYRKAREQAARRKPNPKAQMRETILGANPRAGLILFLLALGILVMFGLPRLLPWLRAL